MELPEATQLAELNCVEFINGKTASMDLSHFATTTFYAGTPDKASATELEWSEWYGVLLTVTVADGVVVATMGTGECEWRTPIDPNNFVGEVDAALKDASDLGRTANWSNDE